jgi:ketosteroid isomerase-like protein
MTVNGLLRRKLLIAVACAALAATSIFAGPNEKSDQSAMKKEEIIKTYYSGWEKKDWNITAAVITDDYNFTSPAGDDHIPISVFKQRCFLNQMNFIKNFKYLSIVSQGDEAFVRYICWTTKGTSFSNVEHFQFKDGKIASVECFFGSGAGYPAAAVAEKH